MGVNCSACASRHTAYTASWGFAKLPRLNSLFSHFKVSCECMTPVLVLIRSASAPKGFESTCDAVSAQFGAVPAPGSSASPGSGGCLSSISGNTKSTACGARATGCVTECDATALVCVTACDARASKCVSWRKASLPAIKCQTRSSIGMGRYVPLLSAPVVWKKKIHEKRSKQIWETLMSLT